MAALTDYKARLSRAVSEFDQRFGHELDRLDDRRVERELHTRLDAPEPLPWEDDPEHVTADEWFFVTTLYGEMTLRGQRTHIRRYFEPLFVQAACRDVRNFRRGMPEYAGLRSAWMGRRLWTMADVLRLRGQTMVAYVGAPRDLERRSTPLDAHASFGRNQAR